MNDTPKQGMLYLCATPIGNLSDISERVLETLKEAGFANVTVDYETTLDPKKVGKVLSQAPDITGLNRFKRYATDTVIVLVVGKGVLS